jgi:hypothetical protein
VIDAVKQRAGDAATTEWSKNVVAPVGHDEDDFENIDNSLIVAKRVDVNTGYRHTKHAKLTRITRKWDTITFDQWKISLRTSIFDFRDENGTEVVESRSALYLDPLGSGSGLPFTVRFGETRLHAAVSFINPVILAYRIVPYRSEVFEAIESDNLADLILLLADGKATVRDCDENGATLLHVSERSKASMCLN